MDRVKLAKSNLKKSIYFGGSIGLVTLGGGLAVAIPTYYKIQAALRAAISDTANLSAQMAEIAAKLGVSPDTSFSTKLESGYTVVFNNGGVVIYAPTKDNADGSALVMNLNQDKSIGSAAAMTGPAALSMLKIINEAKESLGETSAAMQEILEPFASEAEDTSLKIESKVTGLSEAQLLARNALANTDTAAAEAALAALKQSNPEVNALKADDLNVVKQVVANTQSAMEAAKGKTQDEINKENEEKAKELAANIAAAEDGLRETYGNALKSFYSDYHGKINIDPIVALSETDKSNIKAIFAMATADAVLAWAKDKANDLNKVVKPTFDSAKNSISVIVAQEAARSTQAAKEAEAATTNRDLLGRLASKLDTFLRALIRTYGYKNQYDPNEKNASSPTYKGTPNSDTLRSTLEDAVKAGGNGMSQASLDTLKNEIANNLLEGKTGEANNIKLNISKVFDTFQEQNRDVSKIIVLQADKTIYKAGGAIDKSSEYIIAFTGEKEGGIQINNIRVVNATNYPNLDEVNTTIKYISLLESSQLPIELRNAGRKLLKDELSAKPGSVLHGIKNAQYYDEMQKLAVRMSTLRAFATDKPTTQEQINAIFESDYLGHILLGASTGNFKFEGLAQDYIIDGKDIQYNAEKILDVVHKVVELDNPFSTMTTPVDKIYSQSDLNAQYGKWMNKLMEVISVSSNSLDKITFFDQFNQLFSLSDEAQSEMIFGTQGNWEFTRNAVATKQSASIENVLADTLRYIEAAKANGKVFDISTPENQAKISVAAGVSEGLGKQAIPAADAKDIQDKVSKVMTTMDNLAKEDFAAIVKYTDTVFAVLSKDEAVAKLKVVLDPAKLDAAHIQYIKDFNGWIDNIKTSNPGKAITRTMIEQYVWTMDVHTEDVHKDGEAIGDGIVSAVYTHAAGSTNGETYIIRHRDSEDRPLWKVTTDGRTTTLTPVSVTDGSNPTTLKAFDGGGYISSQAASGQNIYYLPLNNPSSFYVVTASGKNVTKLRLDATTASATGLSTASEIRSISVIGNYIYAAAATGDKVWYIDVTTGMVYSGLALPSGYVNSWAMGGTMSGTNPIMVQGVVNTAAKTAGVYVTLAGGNYRSNFIDLTQYFDTNAHGANVFTAIIAGDYIPATQTQTFFVVGIAGEVVKIDVKVADAATPQIIPSATIKLINATPANGDVRGATFANGAITTYTASKAVYIASQTAKLSNIFAYLM